MRYLVTGAAGFIGARFVASCNKRAIDVVSVDVKEYFASRHQHRGISFGTIVDRDELFDWLAQTDQTLDAIVHLGACSDTQETNESLMTRLNVSYPQLLWQYAVQARIPFIYASSAATYGAGELGFDDDEARIVDLKPLNLYGVSKKEFDVWVLEQEQLGNHPPRRVGFKFCNVYGYGENHKGEMASIVLRAFNAIEKQGRVELFRSHKENVPDGHQARDFICVTDVISVLHFALEKPLVRGIYNLGTGCARTYLDLVRATFTALGVPERIIFIDTPKAMREKYQYFTEAKMDKLRAEGYTDPFTPLEKGVAEYVRLLKKDRDK